MIADLGLIFYIAMRFWIIRFTGHGVCYGYGFVDIYHEIGEDDCILNA